MITADHPREVIPVMEVSQTRGGVVYSSRRAVYSVSTPWLVAMSMDRELLRESGFVDPERVWECRLMDGLSIPPSDTTGKVRRTYE